jgi:hypothetical protein
MEKKTPSGIITIVLLLSLVVGNAVWLILSWHGGVLIALAQYLVVSYLCLRKGHFQAGVIAGIVGFGIHLFELLKLGTSQLTGIEQIFFYANLILPVPLIITSYLTTRVKVDTEEPAS